MDIYNEWKEKKVRELSRHASELSDLDANMVSIQNVGDLISPLEGYVSGWYDGDVCINFTGDSECYKALHRTLRNGGYSTDDTPPERKPSFCMYFNHEGGGPRVYVTFSSTVCVRVKVGTEMVEQDVFEIECRDD